MTLCLDILFLRVLVRSSVFVAVFAYACVWDTYCV
jgi:hypothetical protein